MMAVVSIYLMIMTAMIVLFVTICEAIIDGESNEVEVE